MSDLISYQMQYIQEFTSAIRKAKRIMKEAEHDMRHTSDVQAQYLADLIERLQQRITELEEQLKEPEWIALSDKKPDVLEVRVKLVDGSEVNCWAQTDGDFYWKGGGSEMFICEHTVTHWIPQPPKEKDNG